MTDTQPSILIYATGLCGFCHAAKRLLDGKGVSYETIRVDQDPEQKQIMMERSGRHTVPQIFIGDRHVGGFDDLYELDSDGELDALLQPE